MRQLISYLAKSTLNKLEEIRSRDSSHSGGWYCSFFLQIKAFKGSGLLLGFVLVVFHLRRGLVYWSKVLFPRTKYCCQNEAIFIFLKTWSLKLRRAAKVGQLVGAVYFFFSEHLAVSLFLDQEYSRIKFAAKPRNVILNSTFGRFHNNIRNLSEKFFAKPRIHQ